MERRAWDEDCVYFSETRGSCPAVVLRCYSLELRIKNELRGEEGEEGEKTTH